VTVRTSLEKDRRYFLVEGRSRGIRRESDPQGTEREHADRAGHRDQSADLCCYRQNDNPTSQPPVILKSEASRF
jgi:hypothetical protein